MQVTEVRVKLMGRKSERLKAFCSVTFDCEFVVRDVKVIEGTNGLFVAMPSRQLSDRCPTCHNKNTLRAKFCGECGAHLDEGRVHRNGQGRPKLHVDIAHPINTACRENMEKAILEAYQKEEEESERPDYEPQHWDLEDYDHGQPAAAPTAAPATEATPAAPETPVEQAGAEITEEPPEKNTDEDEEKGKFGEGIL